ncbi:MAG TPA: neutral/alkaline non-lysosomal ceramidase N-terminal domain-containing protein [Bryobacteraceae bacterium]|nr:neutral/alkaline non-lysosomal ceramidase N-terminal domain-containing protein [Bryobacteraceae bacterium]
MKTCVLVLFLSFTLGAAPAWKAGVSSVVITPETPIWMAGYADRKQPSQGKLHDIHAKALALDDGSGKPAVLVTTDLLGLTAKVSDTIARDAEKKFGLPRHRLMLTSTHTHCGPVVDRQLAVAYDLDGKQWAAIDAYTRELERRVVTAIGLAIKDLRPARLRLGRSEAGFAKNRRVAVSPNGPADHDVPILRVEDSTGQLRAAVFGYACHNTTLPGTVCEFNGDYAGFAQVELERKYPGAKALFVAGCGADANPHPRGQLELAKNHGDELASAVTRGLNGKLTDVRGPLHSAYELVSLDWAPTPPREEWQRRLKNKNPYEARHAAEMLKIIDRDGHLPTTYPYPVQVWQFGNLKWIALGGEVVVDYTLRLKKAYGPETWVTAYANDVFAYIPSVRVLREGGYEGGYANMYYVQPGPWAETVEEKVIDAVDRLLKKTK